MPYLTHASQRNLHRGMLFADLTVPVRLFKRGDDQDQNRVTEYRLFACRRGQVVRTGEGIAGEITSDTTTSWHVPLAELRRHGIEYLSGADRIVEDHAQGGQGGVELPQADWAWWQPLSDTVITEKLLDTHLDVACMRTDPGP
jgi:hypothetical protein